MSMRQTAPVTSSSLAAKPAAEGASPVFADGCVGGSLPHDDRPPRQRATPREQAPDTRPVLLDAASHVKSGAADAKKIIGSTPIVTGTFGLVLANLALAQILNSKR